MSIGTSQKHFKGTAVIGFSYREERGFLILPLQHIQIKVNTQFLSRNTLVFSPYCHRYICMSVYLYNVTEQQISESLFSLLCLEKSVTLQFS